MRYVALGDSYTIGTSVPPAERWPERLVAAVGPPDAPRLELVANLGVNGATSADLIRGQLPALAGLRPDLVSVLIGVNDVVRGVPPATYEANLERILAALLDRLPAGSDRHDHDPGLHRHAGRLATTATHAGSTTPSWPPTPR